MCAEQGRGKVIHTYQRHFVKWPTADYIDWPSNMITTCPAFTVMGLKEKDDAVRRLGGCTRSGA